MFIYILYIYYIYKQIYIFVYIYSNLKIIHINTFNKAFE